MNPTSTDIKSILEDSSTFVFGTNMFIGSMPDYPSESICIFDTGGYAPFPELSRQDRKPRVMIHVRGSRGDYTGSYATCEAIITALHSQHNIYIGSTRYISIFAVSEPIFLGYDSNESPLWSINFEVNRTA